MCGLALQCELSRQCQSSEYQWLNHPFVKSSQRKACSIKETIRCKNGWSVYDEELPLYKEKFYGTAIYLNDLMFTANILDEQFQRDMMLISEEMVQRLGCK